MTEEFSCRLVGPLDSAAILTLLGRAFPRFTFREDWWQWFAAGPTRSYLLADRGAAIGLFSLIELARSNMALAANLCLAPEYQRKNRGGERSLFAELAREVAQREIDGGMEKLLVVPNPNSAGRLRELGWKEATQLVTWEKRPAASAEATGWDAAQLDASFVSLLNAKGSHGPSELIARTAPFLQWRLEQRPGAAYEFARHSKRSAAVLKRFTDPETGARRVHLMDYGCADEAGFHEVLEFAERSAGSADAVNFWLAEGDALSAVASEKGFQPVSRRPLLACERAGVTEPRQFAFTFADCDVY